MKKVLFNFGNIVVVEENLVGVVVKCWQGSKGNNYDIYVRSWNKIENFNEEDVTDFIYNKELSEEALEFYD